MKNKKVLDKIRKLLSLSTSFNSNEAALALRQARELMDEHDLSHNDFNRK